MGKKVVEVSLQKIGRKGQAAILSSIMRAYGSIPGLKSAASKAVTGLAGLRYVTSKWDDLNQHGVRFTVYVTYETHSSCKCSINRDHGDRQLLPHVRIETSLY